MCEINAQHGAGIKNGMAFLSQHGVFRYHTALLHVVRRPPSQVAALNQAWPLIKQRTHGRDQQAEGICAGATADRKPFK